MGEMARFINSQGKYPTCIQKYPTGKFGIVGAIPFNLTKEVRSGFSVSRSSLVWDTEEDVVNALKAEGIERFQLSNFKWNQ